MSEQAGHKDEGKLRWTELPIEAVEETIKVFMFGAQKYGHNNWQKGMNWMKLANSCFRHLVAFRCGIDVDDESQLLHLAHLVCDALMLIEYKLKDLGVDDRDPKVYAQVNPDPRKESDE